MVEILVVAILATVKGRNCWLWYGLYLGTMLMSRLEKKDAILTRKWG